MRPCRRESLEMLVAAHNRAFFGGSCRRGIHDSMKAAARKIRRNGREERLVRRDLAVLDELGCPPFVRTGGQLLFHLLSRPASARP